jgi:hypothetical protein
VVAIALNATNPTLLLYKGRASSGNPVDARGSWRTVVLLVWSDATLCQLEKADASRSFFIRITIFFSFSLRICMHRPCTTQASSQSCNSSVMLAAGGWARHGDTRRWRNPCNSYMAA